MRTHPRRAVGDPSLGADDTGPIDFEPSAGWYGDGHFLILTWGSSGCPPTIDTVEATRGDEVTVTFADPPADQVCTMDMAPQLTAAAVEGATGDDIELVLTGDGYDDVRVPIAGTR